MSTSILVLDNIRSVHNVGAIFRTAEAAGISEILLVGICPTPLDRFGRSRDDVSKTALGAETMVPWKYFKENAEAWDYLRGIEAEVVALEITDTSVDYRSVSPHVDARPFALVVGNENIGVADFWLERAGMVCHIPMVGNKESLNVSTSCGIALFRILNP